MTNEFSVIETVTQDKTPAVIHVTQQGQQVYQQPAVRCASCGAPIDIRKTCWMWEDQTFCNSQKCKPLRLR